MRREGEGGRKKGGVRRGEITCRKRKALNMSEKFPCSVFDYEEASAVLVIVNEPKERKKKVKIIYKKR